MLSWVPRIPWLKLWYELIAGAIIQIILVRKASWAFPRFGLASPGNLSEFKMLIEMGGKYILVEK